jgi:hypothetical protein
MIHACSVREVVALCPDRRQIIELHLHLRKALRECGAGELELVRELVLSRKRANFISGKAKFAVVCGRSGENFNAG